MSSEPSVDPNAFLRRWLGSKKFPPEVSKPLSIKHVDTDTDAISYLVCNEDKLKSKIKLPGHRMKFRTAVQNVAEDWLRSWSESKKLPSELQETLLKSNIFTVNEIGLLLRDEERLKATLTKSAHRLKLKNAFNFFSQDLKSNTVSMGEKEYSELRMAPRSADLSVENKENTISKIKREEEGSIDTFLSYLVAHAHDVHFPTSGEPLLIPSSESAVTYRYDALRWPLVWCMLASKTQVKSGAETFAAFKKTLEEIKSTLSTSKGDIQRIQAKVKNVIDWFSGAKHEIVSRCDTPYLLLLLKSLVSDGTQEADCALWILATSLFSALFPDFSIVSVDCKLLIKNDEDAIVVGACTLSTELPFLSKNNFHKSIFSSLNSEGKTKLSKRLSYLVGKSSANTHFICSFFKSYFSDGDIASDTFLIDFVRRFVTSKENCFFTSDQLDDILSESTFPKSKEISEVVVLTCLQPHLMKRGPQRLLRLLNTDCAKSALVLTSKHFLEWYEIHGHEDLFKSFWSDDEFFEKVHEFLKKIPDWVRRLSSSVKQHILEKRVVGNQSVSSLLADAFSNLFFNTYVPACSTLLPIRKPFEALGALLSNDFQVEDMPVKMIEGNVNEVPIGVWLWTSLSLSTLLVLSNDDIDVGGESLKMAEKVLLSKSRTLATIFIDFISRSLVVFSNKFTGSQKPSVVRNMLKEVAEVYQRHCVPPSKGVQSKISLWINEHGGMFSSVSLMGYWDTILRDISPNNINMLTESQISTLIVQFYEFSVFSEKWKIEVDTKTKELHKQMTRFKEAKDEIYTLQKFYGWLIIHKSLTESDPIHKVIREQKINADTSRLNTNVSFKDVSEKLKSLQTVYNAVIKTETLRCYSIDQIIKLIAETHFCNSEGRKCIVASSMLEAAFHSNSKKGKAFGDCISNAVDNYIAFGKAPAAAKLPSEYMTHFDVAFEVEKFKELGSVLKLNLQADAIEVALRASFVITVSTLFRAFFRTVGETQEQKYADSKWDETPVVNALRRCDGSMQNALKAVCEMAGIVAVTKDVLSATQIAPDVSDEGIKKIRDFFYDDVGRILNDMSGDTCNTEDHDILVNYRSYMRLVVTLLLTNNNPSFSSLEKRILFICDPSLCTGINTHGSVVENLRAHTSTLTSIIKDRGAVSEAGKVNSFLKSLTPASLEALKRETYFMCIGQCPRSTQLEIQLLKRTVEKRDEKNLSEFFVNVCQGNEDREKHLAPFMDGFRDKDVKLECRPNEVHLVSLFQQRTLSQDKDFLIINTLSIEKGGDELNRMIESVRANSSDHLCCTVYSDLSKFMPLAEEAAWKGYPFTGFQQYLFPLHIYSDPMEKHECCKKEFSTKLESYLNSLMPHADWLYLLPNKVANAICASQTNSSVDARLHFEYVPGITAYLKCFLKEGECVRAGDTVISIASRLAESERYLNYKKRIESKVKLLLYDECPRKTQPSNVSSVSEALECVSSCNPLPFEILFCSEETSVHEVNRFLKGIELFPGGNFFLIGFEMLQGHCRAEVAVMIAKSKRAEGDDQTLPLTVMVRNGSDAHSVLLKVVKETDTRPPEKRNYAADPKPPIFVFGEHGSGKSHYIRSQNAELLRCSGDTITTSDITKTLAIVSGSAQSKTNVWINIDQNMFRPDKVIVEDSLGGATSTWYAPRQLFRLSKTLRSLTIDRVFEDVDGAPFTVPDSVVFLIEVPPTTKAFLFDCPEVEESSASVDTGLGYLSFVASKSSGVALIRTTSKKDSLIEEMSKSQGKALHDKCLFVAKVLQYISLDSSSQWKAVKFPSIFEAFDIFEKISQQSINTFQTFTKMHHFKLLPESIFSHNGKFCALIGSLERSLDFWKDSSRIDGLLQKKDALLNASRLMVKSAVDRWEKDCKVTLEHLAQFGTVLFIDSQFVPYPNDESTFSNDDPILSLSPRRKERAEKAKKKFPDAPTEALDLANVIFGSYFDSDIMNIADSWKRRGIVTVPDILIRFMCITERQRLRIPMIVAGPTGVGKSFLIDSLFEVQVMRAQAKAKERLQNFKIKMIWKAFKKNVKGEKDAIIDACFCDIFKQSLLADVLPEEWKAHLANEMCKAPFYEYPPQPQDLTRSKPTDKYLSAETIIPYFEGIRFRNSSFKIVIHPGITEEEILSFVEEAEEFARDISSTKCDDSCRELIVPVFFDEPNTTTRCAGLIKSLLVDGVNPRTGERYGDQMPLWFIGAINPTSSHYATHVTHEALEWYQCNFGEINENQQKFYVKQMLIATAKKITGSELDEEVRVTLTEIVLTLHTKCVSLFEEKKHKHAVSQRDIHRFAWLVETIFILLSKANANDVSSQVEASDVHADTATSFLDVSLVAIYYTYVARFPQSGKLRKELEFELIAMSGRLPIKASLKDIRNTILRSIVNEQHFDIGEGIALTDTLRENLFASLLACMSPIHKKTPVAIIGDSGMGKTLSNRIVERNLMGKNSHRSYCKGLPKAVFHYIQGSSSTTSKQVDVICSRAKDVQLNNPDEASVVSFDEASLTAKDTLVHKALHEPVDCKIISIVVLSNKPFDDEANQNRFLVIWNQAMERSEVVALSRGCLGPAGTGNNVDALADTFLAIRDHESGKYKQYYQTRDFIFLLKYLRSVVLSESESKTLTIDDVQLGIQLNYGSPHDGMLAEVLDIFISKLSQNGAVKCPGQAILPTFKLLEKCYKRHSGGPLTRPRSVLVITRTRCYYGSEVIKKIIFEADRESGGSGKVECLTIGPFCEDKEKDSICAKLSQVRTAMEKGSHLIIRNPNRIVGSLFDVFNLNFTQTRTTESGRDIIVERANLAFGSNTFKVPIHKDFRVTLVYSSDAIIEEVNKGNTPFLSRMEKYLLDYPLAVCSKVLDRVRAFVDVVHKGRFAMFHEHITIPTAINTLYSDSSPNLDDSSDRSQFIFKVNACLTRLVSLPSFLSVTPRLGDRAFEYLTHFLEKRTGTLGDLVKAARPGSFTVATCEDILSIHKLTEKKDHWHVIDVDLIKSVKELESLVKAKGKMCIVLKMLRTQCDPDVMWSIREIVGSPESASANEEKTFVLVTGPGSSTVASFSSDTQWHYAHIETCDETDPLEFSVPTLLALCGKCEDGFVLSILNVFVKKCFRNKAQCECFVSSVSIKIILSKLIRQKMNPQSTKQFIFEQCCAKSFSPIEFVNAASTFFANHFSTSLEHLFWSGLSFPSGVDSKYWDPIEKIAIETSRCPLTIAPGGAHSFKHPLNPFLISLVVSMIDLANKDQSKRKFFKTVVRELNEIFENHSISIDLTDDFFFDVFENGFKVPISGEKISDALGATLHHFSYSITVNEKLILAVVLRSQHILSLFVSFDEEKEYFENYVGHDILPVSKWKISESDSQPIAVSFTPSETKSKTTSSLISQLVSEGLTNLENIDTLLALLNPLLHKNASSIDSTSSLLQRVGDICPEHLRDILRNKFDLFQCIDALKHIKANLMEIHEYKEYSEVQTTNDTKVHNAADENFRLFDDEDDSERKSIYSDSDLNSNASELF